MIGCLVAVAMLVLVAGDWKGSPLHAWFEQLSSGKGLCCSFADGRTVEDPDWGMQGDSYWVRIDGKKIIVPKDALVTEPNRYGKAVVWPYLVNGDPAVRCFLPGVMA